MTIVPNPSVRCPHGNDFVWECATCYRLLKEERDRYHAALLRIGKWVLLERPPSVDSIYLDSIYLEAVMKYAREVLK